MNLLVRHQAHEVAISGIAMAGVRGQWLGQRLGDLVWLFHTTLTLIVAFCWLGPPWMLWMVIIIQVTVEIQWITQKGWCVLGDLERWLRDEPRPPTPMDQGFVARLFKILLRIEISPTIGHTITRVWGRGAALISILRLSVPWIP